MLRKITGWSFFVCTGCAVIILLVLSFPFFIKMGSALRTALIQDEFYAERHMVIKETPLSVFIADTETKREKGLGGRNELSDKNGMLFVYQKSGLYGIWMKDMHIPIDIMWVDESNRVISLQTNVATTTYPQVFYPEKNALYILETNAGFVEHNKIAKGDLVNIY